MRLQRFLALAGVDSRRKCEQLITSGRVSVNGNTVQELGTRVAPDHDIVELDGARVEVEKKVYVLLNKPRGYLTSVGDPRGRPTVGDLLKHAPVRVFPVGRLDMDTEGVLLLTNDGALCYRLTHPRYGVEKVYRARVAGTPSQEALETLRKGVDIGSAITAPARVQLLGSAKGFSTLEITLHEGRKRQIKRMCKAIGHPVVELTRVEVGGIRADNLKPGQYRHLSEREVSALRRKVSLEASRG